jgi:hypothetical protein
MSFEQAKKNWVKATKESILADQRGFGPDMEAAWKKVGEALEKMREAKEAAEQEAKYKAWCEKGLLDDVGDGQS